MAALDPNSAEAKVSNDTRKKVNPRSSTMLVHELPQTHEIYETVLWDPEDELVLPSESDDDNKDNVFDSSIFGAMTDSDVPEYYDDDYKHTKRDGQDDEDGLSSTDDELIPVLSDDEENVPQPAPPPPSQPPYKPDDDDADDEDDDSGDEDKQSTSVSQDVNEIINALANKNKNTNNNNNNDAKDNANDDGNVSDSASSSYSMRHVSTKYAPTVLKAPSVQITSTPIECKNDDTADKVKLLSSETPPPSTKQATKSEIPSSALPPAAPSISDNASQSEIPPSKQTQTKAKTKTMISQTSSEVEAKEEEIKPAVETNGNNTESSETKTELNETIPKTKETKPTDTIQDAKQLTEVAAAQDDVKPSQVTQEAANDNLTETQASPGAKPTQATQEESKSKAAVDEGVNDKPTKVRFADSKAQPSPDNKSKKGRSRASSRAAKGTIAPPNIPDIVITETDGTQTIIPVRLVFLFARCRTHHKLNNFKNINYASKTYQKDPKLLIAMLEQQTSERGTCSLDEALYAFVKKNIGTQKEYRLALRTNSDNIEHAISMLNFIEAKLDESLLNVKRITKFNHDMCLQSIISEINKSQK